MLREVVSYAAETPDAIGWRASTGWSIMVECKVSRSDFLRDRKKLSRHPLWSMGQFRFYMTPRGLLSVDEIPDGWGLLEVHGKRVRVVKDVKAARELTSLGYRAELMHIMRGVHMAMGMDTLPTKKSQSFIRAAPRPQAGKRRRGVCSGTPWKLRVFGGCSDGRFNESIWQCERGCNWRECSEVGPCCDRRQSLSSDLCCGKSWVWR